MKTYFTLLGILFFSVWAASGQTIPNSGFENWTTSGSYTDPSSWDTPNEQTTGIPIIGSALVTKSSGGHSGSWCARLENKSFIAFTVPAMMTLGQFDVDLVNFTYSMTGGVAFSSRPEKFKGYYKYSPQGGDSCAMLALFYKHNPGGWLDTIGLAYYLDNNTVSTWTAFEAMIDWYTADDPDTMNIIIASAASLTPTAGSVLYVDDLEFDYATTVKEVSFKEDVTLNYLPDLRQIRADYQLKPGQPLSLRVLNITGQTVASRESVSQGRGRLNLDVPELLPGMYIVVLQSGQIKNTRKIVVR